MSSKQQKKTQKKTIYIIIAAVLVAAVAAGFGIHAIVSRDTAQELPKVELSPLFDGAIDMLENGNPPSTTASSADAEAASSADAAEGESLASGEVIDLIDGTSQSDGADGGYSGGVSGTGGNSGGTGHSVSGGESAQTESKIPTISFPYNIPGTDLIVNQISPYSGYFIEDGSDQSVSGIAAIVLTNNGGDLDFAGIGISQGDRNLAFSASQIPAGATVIIQEQNKSAYANDDYYSCTATTTESDGFDLANGRVVIEESSDGSFLVANISEETIPEAKVYFKNYLPDEDVYVGGITYSVTLTDIEPQTAVTVNSSHYDSQYSTIIDIVTGE